MLSPSFSMVGFVEMKKVTTIAIAFFWGSYRKKEGDDTCRCLFLGGLAKKKKLMEIFVTFFFLGSCCKKEEEEGDDS